MDMSSGAGSSGVKSSGTDSGAYTDLNRLNSLKVGDRDSEPNLRKVAQEFESVFVGQMLKSMRSANDVLAKDNPMNSEAVKQYQDMYDQQLSVSLSHQGNGIGLQDVLMRQLSKTKDVAHTGSNPFNRPDANQHALGAVRNGSAESHSAAASAHNDMAMLNQRRLALPSKSVDRLLAGIVPGETEATSRNTLVRGEAPHANLLHPQKANRINAPVTAPASDAIASTASATGNEQSAGSDNGAAYGDWTQNYAGAPKVAATGSRTIAQVPLAPGKAAFGSHEDFIATMLPMAQEAAARIGVDPKVLVAQAALETGWGKSVLRQSDGSTTHNLFNIKAGSSWKGDTARAVTAEYEGGEMVKESAQFRSYDSFSDSFHDLVNLLQNNDRYQDVVKSADNPEQFVKELQKAGYATDPHYASKIAAIAKQLQSYENYASSGSSTTL
ncbi:flagellar assembly peptidoglycan hydrolase FlgJ [Pseudomonas sp. RIT-PI-S]|uniref:flagellar assembly peptidoglycan hydrolase FlgJ n=1 Tax=Pseudomonas sp. RIT-PI-S TaxID=3035295 RepID=UPI0021D8E27B|nr:flagellar assembly peptidoglycan hydrolase FlgJ [Pseudomonas sp. RIT-PI-S]